MIGLSDPLDSRHGQLNSRYLDELLQDLSTAKRRIDINGFYPDRTLLCFFRISS